MHVINDILLPFVFPKNKGRSTNVIDLHFDSFKVNNGTVCFLFILHSVDVAFRFVLGV